MMMKPMIVPQKPRAKILVVQDVMFFCFLSLLFLLFLLVLRSSCVTNGVGLVGAAERGGNLFSDKRAGAGRRIRDARKFASAASRRTPLDVAENFENRSRSGFDRENRTVGGFARIDAPFDTSCRVVAPAGGNDCRRFYLQNDEPARWQIRDPWRCRSQTVVNG
jgi:hypothetical protein